MVNMKSLALVLAFLVGVARPKVIGFGGQAGDGEFETKCTPYYDTEYKEKCEPYTEKVCYTTHEETCVDVGDKSCKAIITSKHEKKCFNVTELFCSLDEDIQYKTIQAVFTVQKCRRVPDRVCDTVYEAMVTEKRDYKCIIVSSPDCKVEQNVIEDKTCRTFTKFDCDYGGGYGAGYGANYRGASSDQYSSGGGDYGAGGGYGGQGEEQECKKTLQTKCFTNPRTVTSRTCSSGEEEVCENVVDKVPMPSERQLCHDTEKKVCELEQRSRPKQIKHYSYSKKCRSVPRTVCETVQTKQLVPSCVPASRKQCTFTPSEKCEELPRKHCHKVAVKVKKQKCETVQKPAQEVYDTAAGYS